jgi:hypothetical protein
MTGYRAERQYSPSPPEAYLRSRRRGMMRFSHIALVGVIALVWIAAGCDLLESKDEENGEPVPVSATITPAGGGSLTASDNRVTLDFPAGAVTETTEVTIAATPSDSGFSYGLEPDGLQFQEPVAVTFTAEASDILDETGSPLDLADGIPAVFALLENSDGSVEFMDSVRVSGWPSGDSLTVTAELSHFCVLDFEVSCFVRIRFQAATVGCVGEWFNADLNIALAGNYYATKHVKDISKVALDFVEISTERAVWSVRNYEHDPKILLPGENFYTTSRCSCATQGMGMLCGTTKFTPTIELKTGFIGTTSLSTEYVRWTLCSPPPKPEVFVRSLDAGYEHFSGYSKIWVSVGVLHDSYDKMPDDALVSVQLTRPDDTTETGSAWIWRDGDTDTESAYMEFTIYEYGTYTISVTDIFGYYMDYAPARNLVTTAMLEVR